MGERGPPPKPANVHLLHGNPGHKPMASLLDDVVRPKVEIPGCPGHLGKEARAEWRRITPHLEKLGLISQIDKAALGAYCFNYGEWVWAANRIAEINKSDPTGEAGRIGETPSKYKQISVLQQIINRSLDQMGKYLSMFGMSPSARSRVTQSDPQLPLPGVEAKASESGWGNF